MEQIRRGLESFKALYRETSKRTFERIPEDAANAALYAIFHLQSARSRYAEWEDRREDLEYLERGKTPPHGYPLKGMTPEDFKPILQSALPLIEGRIKDRLRLADEWLGKYSDWKEEFSKGSLQDVEDGIAKEREKLRTLYQRQPVWFEGLEHIYALLEK